MPSYKATIKVNKLDKSAFFKGKNGDTYCSIVLWENRDGADDYGNTHSIKQDLGKERKGEKSDYVGNAKPIGGGGDQPDQNSRRNQYGGVDRTANEAKKPAGQNQPVATQADDEDETIPF